mgnify:CR=1 FL=1
MNFVARKMGGWLSRYLSRENKRDAIGIPTDIHAMQRCLRVGDVVLVEGNTKFSTAIKYLTQSTWSHAMLYVGNGEFIEADVAKGMDKAKACAACHDFAKGGPNKVGPELWDVIERPIGAAAGFAYSDGVKALAGKNWTYDDMNAWLKAPKEFIKGTKMGYSGIKNEQERANVIAYLASLSDAPKPFPKP